MKRALASILFAISCLAITAAMIPPGTAQLIYGNTFPFWNVNGPLTVTGATTTAGITNTGNIQTTTMNSTGAFTPTGGIVGVTNASNATAGNVGEYLVYSATSANPVTVSTGTAANIACGTVGAGDWDMFGTATYSLIAATGTELQAGIGLSGVNTGDNTYAMMGISETAATKLIPIATPIVRLSSSVSSTQCLVATGTFSAGAEKVFGVLNARRVR